jgi:putative ABC transport system substrate-binding protein
LGVARHLKAQSGGGAHRLGYLGLGPKADARERDLVLAGLLRRLGELGYVEGRNLQVDLRFAEGRPDDLSALALQLVQARPDVIAVGSAGLAEKVLEHTSTVPVVALQAGQLQAEPRVQSIRRPGGNLTGMQLHSPEMIGKRLQLLRDLVPGLRRVAVLRGVPFEGPGYLLYRDANEAAATQLGIQTRYLQFRSAADLDALFAEMAGEQVQALLVWGNPHLNAHRRQIADLALRYRLPALYDVRYPEIAADELIIYSAKISDVQREAASYVDRIFRGAKPGDLPIGQARVFELVVNLRVARAIGLSIPKSVLLRADEVIE